MVTQPELQDFAVGGVTSPAHELATDAAGDADLILADAFGWLEAAEPEIFHAVVTDPPYSLVEYRSDQLAKRGKRFRRRLAHPA